MISIIVPVYNAEGTLRKCVGSLTGQTCSDIEILLVNDGSTDGSLRLCRELAQQDDRIRVINKENGGVSSARNTGLDAARGEYIMFCDSDDWADPHWCEVMTAESGGKRLVLCGSFVEGEKTPFEGNRICAEKKQKITKADALVYQGYFYNAPTNKLFLSDVIARNRLRFDTRFSNGEDWLFYLQYLNSFQGEIVELDVCLYHYVWHESGSASTDVPEGYLSQVCRLYEATSREIAKIDAKMIDEKYYTGFFNQFQKAILALYNQKKRKALGEALRLPAYRKCAENGFISPNRVYSRVWRRKSGTVFMIEYSVFRLLWKTSGKEH